MAVAGDITESIGAATIGKSKVRASIVHVSFTSSGVRVRRVGTMAMSSKPYTWVARLARPISIMSLT
jgi:hypothetical protein